MHAIRDSKFIGQRMRQLREGVGLSQSAVGALLEVSYQQVQKYERGINRISVEKLQRLAEALRVPMTAFFEDTPRPSPSRSRWKREGRITSSLLSQTVRAMCCDGSEHSRMRNGAPASPPSSNSSHRCSSVSAHVLLDCVGVFSAVVVACPPFIRGRGTMWRGMLAISLSCSLVRSKLISISSSLMVRCFAMTWIIPSRSCSMVPWARPPRSYVNASFRRSFAACLLGCA